MNYEKISRSHWAKHNNALKWIKAEEFENLSSYKCMAEHEQKTFKLHCRRLNCTTLPPLPFLVATE